MALAGETGTPLLLCLASTCQSSTSGCWAPKGEAAVEGPAGSSFQGCHEMGARKGLSSRPRELCLLALRLASGFQTGLLHPHEWWRNFLWTWPAAVAARTGAHARTKEVLVRTAYTNRCLLVSFVQLTCPMSDLTSDPGCTKFWKHPLVHSLAG